MQLGTPTWSRRFRGGILPPAYDATNPAEEFVQKITGAAPPTVTSTGKGWKLALTSASQAQCVQVYNKDVFPFEIEELQYLRIRAYIASGEQLSAAEVKAFIGVGSAINAAYASMTALAGFSITGGATQGNVFCETDDNVNDKSADTTLAMPTAVRDFWLDFRNGLVSGGPPSTHRGGQGSVRFAMSGAGAAPNRGNWQTVCRNTDFNMENYTSGLQLVFQIEKASGAGTGALVVEGFDAWLRE
jgi:hypothetical protein